MFDLGQKLVLIWDISNNVICVLKKSNRWGKLR